MRVWEGINGRGQSLPGARALTSEARGGLRLSGSDRALAAKAVRSAQLTTQDRWQLSTLQTDKAYVTSKNRLPIADLYACPLKEAVGRHGGRHRPQQRRLRLREERKQEEVPRSARP